MVTLGFGVAMTIVASGTNDVIAAITVAYDLLVGALFVPVIGAMLWARGTGAGALASIAVSAPIVIVMIFVQGIDSDAPIYAGFGMSLLVYVVISLITRPNPAAMLGGERLRVES
jgi:SSS family solute:Na+ symporter